MVKVILSIICERRGTRSEFFCGSNKKIGMSISNKDLQDLESAGNGRDLRIMHLQRRGQYWCQRLSSGVYVLYFNFCGLAVEELKNKLNGCILLLKVKEFKFLLIILFIIHKEGDIL